MSQLEGAATNTSTVSAYSHTYLCTESLGAAPKELSHAADLRCYFVHSSIGVRVDPFGTQHERSALSRTRNPGSNPIPRRNAAYRRVRSVLHSDTVRAPRTSNPPINPNFSGSLSSCKRVILPGKFDALHLGHKQLFVAAARIGTPVVLTFPGMGDALGWAPRNPMLTDEERAGILSNWAESLGVSVELEQLEFESIRTLSPRKFIELLIERLEARGVVCGFSWRFGFRAAGTADTLLEIAREAESSLEVSVVPPLQIDGEVVSSTRIRTLLKDHGDVQAASRLLGRHHSLCGRTCGVSQDSAHRENSLVIDEIKNFMPLDGNYECCVRFQGRTTPLWGVCRVRDSRVYIQNAGDLWDGAPVETSVELRALLPPHTL